ncbi:MAG: SDR family NAD(P)-dependent oxidoreductase [Dermatophilaceae bacterium]
MTRVSWPGRRAMLRSEGEVRTRPCDVRDGAAVQEMVASVESEIGPIDTLVTVAGIIQVAPLESVTLEQFDDALATMTWGPIHLAMAVLPGMRRRGTGRIGTVTSVGGVVSPPHLLPYATAKFGAVGFSDGLAAALRGSGISATTIVPGLMRTGSPEHALFGGDAGREYAWFGPAASLPLLSMDADRAAPRMVDGVLARRPVVTLTPLAFVAGRFRGLAPATTIRMLGVVNRLLPSAPAAGGRDLVEGQEADRRLDSALVRRLVTLGTRAARRTNQRSAD